MRHCKHRPYTTYKYGCTIFFHFLVSTFQPYSKCLKSGVVHTCANCFILIRPAQLKHHRQAMCFDSHQIDHQALNQKPLRTVLALSALDDLHAIEQRWLVHGQHAVHGMLPCGGLGQLVTVALLLLSPKEFLVLRLPCRPVICVSFVSVAVIGVVSPRHACRAIRPFVSQALAGPATQSEPPPPPPATPSQSKPASLNDLLGTVSVLRFSCETFGFTPSAASAQEKNASGRSVATVSGRCKLCRTSLFFLTRSSRAIS